MPKRPTKNNSGGKRNGRSRPTKNDRSLITNNRLAIQDSDTLYDAELDAMVEGGVDSGNSPTSGEDSACMRVIKARIGLEACIKNFYGYRYVITGTGRCKCFILSDTRPRGSLRVFNASRSGQCHVEMDFKSISLRPDCEKYPGSSASGGGGPCDGNWNIFYTGEILVSRSEGKKYWDRWHECSQAGSDIDIKRCREKLWKVMGRVAILDFLNNIPFNCTGDITGG